MEFLKTDTTLVICEVILIVIVLFVGIHFEKKKREFLNKKEKEEKTNQEKLLQKTLENKKRSN
jgi:hypothetical protein